MSIITCTENSSDRSTRSTNCTLASRDCFLEVRAHIQRATFFTLPRPERTTSSIGRSRGNNKQTGGTMVPRGGIAETRLEKYRCGAHTHTRTHLQGGSGVVRPRKNWYTGYIGVTEVSSQLFLHFQRHLTFPYRISCTYFALQLYTVASNTLHPVFTRIVLI